MISEVIEKIIRDARGEGCTCVPLPLDWKRKPNGDLVCIVTHEPVCLRLRNN